MTGREPESARQSEVPRRGGNGYRDGTVFDERRDLLSGTEIGLMDDARPATLRAQAHRRGRLRRHSSTAGCLSSWRQARLYRVYKYTAAPENVNETSFHHQNRSDARLRSSVRDRINHAQGQGEDFFRVAQQAAKNGLTPSYPGDVSTPVRKFFDELLHLLVIVHGLTDALLPGVWEQIWRGLPP